MASNLDEDGAGSAALVRFGANLRRLRAVAGLTQEGLAHASGLDRSYVGQVERGERNIALLNIVRLLSALNAEANDLLDGVVETESDDAAD